MKHFFGYAALAVLTLTLAACGGGGSSPAAPTSSNLIVTGTASTGLAIAGATVTGKCKAGTGNSSTLADGTFTLTITDGQLPCILQVVNPADGTKLHTLVSGFSSTAVANITPLTEMTTAKVLGSEPNVFYAAFDAAAATQKVTTANITSAQAVIDLVFTGTIDTTSIGDFITTSLVAATQDSPNSGDTHDKLLNVLKRKFSIAQLGTVTTALASNQTTDAIKQTVISLSSSVSSTLTANAGVEQSVIIGAKVTLDASASTVSADKSLTFVWTLISRPAGSGATLAGSTTAKPTFTADAAGTYIASLTINDGTISSSAAAVTVFASVTNAAPVANAGTTQNVVAGSVVTLDGSASSDANGDTLTYSWTLTSKPAGSVATLTGSTVAKPTLTADLVGNYVAKLTVNDGKVNSPGVTVSITAVVGNLIKVGSSGGSANAVAIQSDGKIILAGNSGTVNRDQDVGLVRLNPNGSLDADFGINGIVNTNVYQRQASTDWVRGVAIQADGKIIVAGYTKKVGASETALLLVRYDTAGNLDPSFAGTGILISLDLAKDKYGHAIALQPDGKILVAGAVNCIDRRTPGYCTLIERYNSDGSPDMTFDGPGVARVDSSTMGAQGIALQADGNILVVGTKNSGNADALSVARFGSNGQSDTTFGIGGVKVVEIGTEVGAYNTGTAIALQTDGKIVVSGVAHTNSTNNHFSLSRLQSSGAVDTTFGSGGSVVTFVAVPPESDISYGVVVQADGKVVVVGESTTARTNTFPYPGFVSLANVNFAAVRYTAAGVLDTSFGSSGMVTTDVNLLDDRCYAVVLQADGSLVLAGGSFTYDPSDTIYGGYSSFAVVRYKTDGKLDPAFTSIK